MKPGLSLITIPGSSLKFIAAQKKSLIQLCDLTEADAVRVSDFHTTELPCCS
jgi:hypothetical protein